jgi:hypothetical protein
MKRRSDQEGEGGKRPVIYIYYRNTDRWKSCNNQYTHAEGLVTQTAFTNSSTPLQPIRVNETRVTAELTILSTGKHNDGAVQTHTSARSSVTCEQLKATNGIICQDLG